jgi:hypothetical protein
MAVAINAAAAACTCGCNGTVLHAENLSVLTPGKGFQHSAALCLLLLTTCRFSPFCYITINSMLPLLFLPPLLLLLPPPGHPA